MDYALARNAVVTPEDPTPDYIDGNRLSGIVGSYPPAKFFNQLQREVLAVIENAGLEPSANNLEQLYEAILALIAAGGGGGGGGGGGPYVPTTRTLTAGAGLTGGGDLSANRTFNLDLSDLTAITTLENADMFGVYDNSASATRKISWGTLLALILAAIDGGDGTAVPGYGEIGSYAQVSVNFAPGGGLAPGTLVSGATYGLTGTWRVHGSSIGVSDPTAETIIWLRSYLIVRVS